MFIIINIYKLLSVLIVFTDVYLYTVKFLSVSIYKLLYIKVVPKYKLEIV